jgi:hypothetical protein
MTARSISCVTAAAFVGALMVSAPTAVKAGGVGVTMVAASTTSGVVALAKGRFKKDGDLCNWDANDDGPNQCTPWVAGHFRKLGKTCVWNGAPGSDECRPDKGRWKVSGDNCTWDASDTGPDQCNPRKAK